MDSPVHGQREPRTERVNVRLTTAEQAEIDRIAEKEQRTRSDMVRILINRGMERP